MTNREFLEAVAKGEINEDIKAEATAKIALLEKRNSDRKAKQSDKHAELRVEIIKVLKEYEAGLLAGEIAKLTEVATATASGVLQGMAKNGTITAEKIEIRGAGTKTLYKVA